jgi:hypothetical protein
VIRIWVAIVALVLAALGGAATVKTNVRGIVVGGPAVTCPRDQPCDPVLKPAFVVFSRAGRTPVRARIGPSGGFAVHLAPGRYAIRLAPPQRRLTPSSVRVPAAGVVHLRLVVRAQ